MSGPALSLLLLLAAGPSEGPRSTLIYPEQQLPLAFDHEKHLREGLDCGFCHTPAWESTRTADRLLPLEGDCLTCHDLVPPDPGATPLAPGEPPAGCPVCHPGAPQVAAEQARSATRPRPPAVVLPPARVHFNHQLHVTRGLQCEQCHGDMKGVGLATRAQLPAMIDCLACHDGERAPSRCTSCHESTVEGRVRTAWPEGRLKPATDVWGVRHDADFVYRHASRARAGEALCMSCHERRDCEDCHAGVMRPMTAHPGDFIALHPLYARARTLDCTSCHREQSFCLTCHQRLGVSRELEGFSVLGTDGRLLDEEVARRLTNPAARDAAGNPLAFHPPDWVFGDRGEGHHSVHAQRNIETCAACHTEQTCLTCHASSELGGTFSVQPHPAFASKCDILRGRNERRCLKCHTAGGLDAACD